MIKLTKEELSKLKPINNLVLVTPAEDRSNVKLTEDCNIKMDTDFTETQFNYVPVIQKVVAVPDNLIMKQPSLTWSTKMELQVGDEVVINQMPIQFQQRDKSFIVCDGVIYFWIQYSDIYAIYDKNDSGFNLIPLNGFVLAEPIYNTIRFGEYEKKERVEKCAIVRWTGSKCTNHFDVYNSEGQSVYTPMDADCEVGDIIYFKKHNFRYLETGYKKILGDLILVRRKDIYFVEEGSHE